MILTPRKIHADINQRVTSLELLQLTSDESKIKQLEHERDDIKNINKTENATKRIQNRELVDAIFQEESDKVRADFAQQRYDAYVKTLENIYQQADATAFLTLEQKQLTDEAVKLADTINNEIVTGIQGMIDGTKTLGETMSSVLSKIADQMLRMSIMGESGSGGLFGSILKGIGGIFSGNPLGGFAPSLSRSLVMGRIFLTWTWVCRILVTYLVGSALQMVADLLSAKLLWSVRKGLRCLFHRDLEQSFLIIN